MLTDLAEDFRELSAGRRRGGGGDARLQHPEQVGEPPQPHFLRESGGMFRDMAIHDFDMARYLVGDIAEVHAFGAVLVDPASLPLLRAISERERCPIAVIGTISGSGRVRVVDSAAPPGSPYPEDLDLEVGALRGGQGALA